MKIFGNIKKFSLIPVILSTLTACGLLMGSNTHPAHSNGSANIQGDEYISPQGNFSITVPYDMSSELSNAMEVRSSVAEHAEFAGFAINGGDIYRIEVASVEEMDAQGFRYTKETVDKINTMYVNNVIAQAYNAAVVSISDGETITVDGKNGFYHYTILRNDAQELNVFYSSFFILYDNFYITFARQVIYTDQQIELFHNSAEEEAQQKKELFDFVRGFNNLSQ